MVGRIKGVGDAMRLLLQGLSSFLCDLISPGPVLVLWTWFDQLSCGQDARCFGAVRSLGLIAEVLEDLDLGLAEDHRLAPFRCSNIALDARHCQ